MSNQGVAVYNGTMIVPDHPSIEASVTADVSCLGRIAGDCAIMASND